MMRVGGISCGLHHQSLLTARAGQMRFLPCRRARWVPVCGYQTCIRIGPRTLVREHRYPISSTPFANTVWYIRSWRHPLSWCASHSLSSYVYQRLCRYQSGGGRTAGAISGSFQLVSPQSSLLVANHVASCVLFLFSGFCSQFCCSTTISSNKYPRPGVYCWFGWHLWWSRRW